MIKNSTCPRHLERSKLSSKKTLGSYLSS